MGDVQRVLQLPPQPWVVGWWRHGVGVAASHGAVVLAVHLDSRRFGAGPFSRLTELRRGDPVSVWDERGDEHDYLVSRVATYRKTSVPFADLFAQDGPARVVLVTCGGRYRPDAGGWDSNVVATLVPA